METALTNKADFKRIALIVKNIQQTPFEGIGKPEPLKHDLAGCWSRRINDKDRLVYQVTDEEILIVSCRYHYGDK